MIRRTNELRILQVLERLVANVSIEPSSSVALRSAARKFDGQHIINKIRIETDDSKFEEWNEERDARPELFEVRVSGMNQLEPGMIVCIHSWDGSKQFAQILKCYPSWHMILFCEFCDGPVPRLEDFGGLHDHIWVSRSPILRKFMRKSFGAYRDHGRFHPLDSWR